MALGGLAISGASPASAITITPTRIEGADRYATSVALATKYIETPVRDSWGGNIILASGNDSNISDALSAAQLAKEVDAPILLVGNDSLPTSVRDWMIANRAGIQAETAPKVFVVGGTSAVSDSLVSTVVGTLNSGLASALVTSERLGGDTRYGTSKAINTRTGMIDNNDKLYVAGGSAYADAVAAAPYVYASGNVLALTAANSLSADLGAVITAYLAVDSSPEIVILGGPAAVSLEVEEAIASITGISYADITRVQGADRYATNVAIAAHFDAGGNGALTGFENRDSALMSGSNLIDALAAAPYLGRAGIDPILVPATGVAPTNAIQAQQDTITVIGGTSAVSAAVASGSVAVVKALQDISTSMTCAEGSDSVTITYTGVAGVTANPAADLWATNTHILLNGVASSESNSNAGATLSATTGSGSETIAVTGTSLAAGTVVSFAGVVGSASGRSIAGSSCTVADDATGPTLTIKATPNADGVFYVEASEPVSLVYADLTLAVASVPTNATTVTDISGTNTLWKVVLKDADGVVALEAADTIAIAAGATTDTAGNNNVATGTVTVAADAVAPTVSAMTATCTGTATGTVTAGGLTFASTVSGVASNGWSLVVKDVASKLIPSIVVDATAKSVTVSADVYRVSADDVEAYAATHLSIPAGWSLTSGGGEITPTSTGNTITSGRQSCTLTYSSNEYLSASTASLTVNGVATDLNSGPTISSTNAKTVTATVTGLAAGANFVLTISATDVAGNAFGGSLTASA
jgi:putative cell wall-binding protein